jgi:RimJ/RimL family protein N-acetyltransferase
MGGRRLPARAESGEVVDPLPPGIYPARVERQGRAARIEPVDGRIHAEELYAASHGVDGDERLWDYMGYGPFPSLDAFRSWLRDCSATPDPLFFAIRDLDSGLARGMASFLDIQPKNGSIEIGHIWLGRDLQRTRAATEALYLMMSYVMDDLGYRRLFWKCNALNAASRRAAVRFGFTFEGVLYRHLIVKGRNRDTAYYSILDDEWPLIRECFETWLAPDNFDESGRQIQSLSDLTAARQPNG